MIQELFRRVQPATSELIAENERLRRENAILRKLLAERRKRVKVTHPLDVTTSQ